MAEQIKMNALDPLPSTLSNDGVSFLFPVSTQASNPHHTRFSGSYGPITIDLQICQTALASRDYAFELEIACDNRTA